VLAVAVVELETEAWLQQAGLVVVEMVELEEAKTVLTAQLILVEAVEEVLLPMVVEVLAVPEL
jgi:hypothetical protein